MLQSRWFSKRPLGVSWKSLVKICEDMTSISSQPWCNFWTTRLDSKLWETDSAQDGHPLCPRGPLDRWSQAAGNNWEGLGYGFPTRTGFCWTLISYNRQALKIHTLSAFTQAASEKRFSGWFCPHGMLTQSRGHSWLSPLGQCYGHRVDRGQGSANTLQSTGQLPQ